ncbi:MAG TPA: arylamine N-acetyltransferase [Gemmataceae bacterium]|nr:arylamine N-acetyltransferase [Gemmataceae bacterium]
MHHPLEAPPRDAPLLQQFLQAHGIDAARPPVEVLGELARAFAGLPFENLTKIIKESESGRREDARRMPDEVLADHWALGAGGTCFALTSTLLHLVRALGFPAEPILADRRYGADTHSGLLVWLDGKPHLLDPGYLIVKPLPLPESGEVRVPTPFNELILEASDGGKKVALSTRQEKQTTYRLTFKTTPVDAGEFLRAWDLSFEADMMRYPVLSRVVEGRQLYLQKQHLMVRGADATSRAEVPPDQLIVEVARQFRIAPVLVAKALTLLQRKGETRGWSVRA